VSCKQATPVLLAFFENLFGGFRPQPRPRIAPVRKWPGKNIPKKYIQPEKTRPARSDSACHQAGKKQFLPRKSCRRFSAILRHWRFLPGTRPTMPQLTPTN
jgi:hypothetical protein